MSKAWDGGELGQFEYDGFDWVADHHARYPGFTAYDHDPDIDRDDLGYRIRINSEEQPDSEAVALLEELVGSADRVKRVISQALFDDVMGEGPGSGVWWEGNAEDVEDVIGVDLPDEPEAWAALLELGSIVILETHRLAEVQGPVAVMNFSALFEEDHGIGFLTDGQAVYGIGYAEDVPPFGMLDSATGDE
ncbi:MAG: hypothetical protein AAGB29_02940 [Planctomycetota bacterium]